MARERIQNERDAREARHDHHKVKRHKNNVSVHAGPKVDHSMTGVGMNGFELDPVAMTAALNELARLRGELQGLRNRAAHLAEPLPDGGGLVAQQMRKAFVDRADVDNGVQAVLDDYIAELIRVEESIKSTLADYRSLDARAVSALQAGEVI